MDSLVFLLLSFTFLMLRIFTGKSIMDAAYQPVKGTVFNMLFYSNNLYDYQTQLATKFSTFRFLVPAHSEVFTVDTRNIEHILKTNFDKYSKGQYSKELTAELFGQGIFLVDGEKWKQQRRLASFEFSTKFLRDFSCSVFRENAAKLDLLMRCTMDSIFQVGFGVELNCLEGSNKEGSEFMKAFDDSNAQLCWRFVDPFWKLKRFLSIGFEASLKRSLRIHIHLKLQQHLHVPYFVHHLSCFFQGSLF